MHDQQTLERIGLGIVTHRAELLATSESVYAALRHCRSLIEDLENDHDDGKPLKAGALDAVLGTCEAAMGFHTLNLERLASDPNEANT